MNPFHFLVLASLPQLLRLLQSDPFHPGPCILGPCAPSPIQAMGSFSLHTLSLGQPLPSQSWPISLQSSRATLAATQPAGPSNLRSCFPISVEGTSLLPVTQLHFGVICISSLSLTPPPPCAISYQVWPILSPLHQFRSPLTQPPCLHSLPTPIHPVQSANEMVPIPRPHLVNAFQRWLPNADSSPNS